MVPLNFGKQKENLGHFLADKISSPHAEFSRDSGPESKAWHQLRHLCTIIRTNHILFLTYKSLSFKLYLLDVKYIPMVYTS
jgi:hypothetical protein